MSAPGSAWSLRLAEHGAAYLRLAHAEGRAYAHELVRRVAWSLAALFCGALSIAFAGLAVIAAHWDGPRRLAAIVAVASGCAIAGLGALVAARRPWPTPFRHLREEWQRDAAMLKASLESNT
jgi:uncharacterized membrane protein YqjE